MGLEMRCHHPCHHTLVTAKTLVNTASTQDVTKKTKREGEKKRCFIPSLIEKVVTAPLTASVFKSFWCHHTLVTDMVTGPSDTGGYEVIRP